MGAEYKIMLAPGEIQKVKRWHASLQETELQTTLTEGYTQPVHLRVWLESKRNVVEIGYSFGTGLLAGGFAVAIGAELMQRVKVKKWGWDSVGWLSDKERAENGIPRPFRSEIKMRKKYAEAHPLEGKALEYYMEECEAMERDRTLLETWAAKLFQESWHE